MNTRRKTPDFLNGVPELLLLRMLARQPMYGYELVNAIRVATDEALEFGEGCIYPVLHRLQAEGALSAERKQVGGRSRVVYCVTAKGQSLLAASTTTWQRVVGAVQTVLQGAGHDIRKVA